MDSKTWDLLKRLSKSVLWTSIALLLTAVLAAGLIQWGISNYPSIVKWWFLLAALPAAWGLFALRCWQRALYGLLEVIVGVLAVGNASPSAGRDPTNLTAALAVIAGVYIIIRGLDNIDQGLPAYKSAFLYPPDAWLLQFYWEIVAKGRIRKSQRARTYRRLVRPYLKPIAAEFEQIASPKDRPSATARGFQRKYYVMNFMDHRIRELVKSHY